MKYNEMKLFNDTVKSLYDKENLIGYNKGNVIIGQNNKVISPNTHSLYYIFTDVLRQCLSGLNPERRFDTDKICDFSQLDLYDKVPLQFDSLKPTDTKSILVKFKTPNDEVVVIDEKTVKPYFGNSYITDLKFYGSKDRTNKSPVYVVISETNTCVAMILPVVF